MGTNFCFYFLLLPKKSHQNLTAYFLQLSVDMVGFRGRFAAFPSVDWRLAGVKCPHMLRQTDDGWLLGAQWRWSAWDLMSLPWLGSLVFFHAASPCAYLELFQTWRSQDSWAPSIVIGFQEHNSKSCKIILRLRFRNGTASPHLILLFKRAGVSNQRPTHCMQPKVAMNLAQHKIIHLLKTFFFLISFHQCLCI